MPSTLTGLVLFTALLTPEFVFLARRETRFPGKGYSVLRETSAIATASLACDIVVLGLFALLTAVLPDLTPDIGRLVREGWEYARTDYQAVAIWAVVLLACATLLAFEAAVLRVILQPDPRRGAVVLPQPRPRQFSGRPSSAKECTRASVSSSPRA